MLQILLGLQKTTRLNNINPHGLHFSNISVADKGDCVSAFTGTLSLMFSLRWLDETLMSCQSKSPTFQPTTGCYDSTLLDIAVDLAAEYCKNLQYNTTFIHYSKIL